MPSDPVPPLAVIVNPERDALADDLLEALALALPHARPQVVRLDRADQLLDAVGDAVDAGAGLVAAVGGDGTQRTAAEALIDRDAALVVVPGGTVNLLGQVLGITTVDDAVRAITDGQERVLDVGEVDGERFVLNAGTGFDAAVMQRVDDQAKRFGRLGYLSTGLRLLRDERPHRVVVTVDEEVAYRGRAMSVIVANVAQRASARFVLAPDAEPDDGRIDVVVQRCDTVPTIARAVLALARGVRPRDDDVITAQGTTIDVRWSRPVWSQQDGDARGRGTAFAHSVLPGVLRVRVPRADPA